MEAAVIAALKDTERPMTAYAIQDRAASQGLQLYPTQIYRTMRRLTAGGRVTRIESINAFVLTSGPADAIAICNECGRAAPVAASAAASALMGLIADSGFEVSHLVVEAHGRCAECLDLGRNIPEAGQA